MGLGKTAQVIGFLAFLKSQRVNGPFLIIVPLSCLQGWINEFNKMAPSINVLKYHGNKQERISLRKRIRIESYGGYFFKDAENGRKIKINIPPINPTLIVITSFEIAMNDSFLIGKGGFGRIRFCITLTE